MNRENHHQALMGSCVHNGDMVHQCVGHSAPTCVKAKCNWNGKGESSPNTQCQLYAQWEHNVTGKDRGIIERFLMINFSMGWY